MSKPAPAPHPVTAGSIEGGGLAPDAGAGAPAGPEGIDGAGPAGPAGLARQVEPVRPLYRQPRAIVLASAGLIAASGALFAWTIMSRPEPRPDVLVPTIALSMLPALEEPPAMDPLVDEEPTAALAADDAIGAPVDRLRERRQPAWLGVATSSDRFGVVALWTDREIWVSRDDGRSFRQELAGQEAVTAVAVGVDGRVFAARHGRPAAVLTPGGRTRSLSLACDQVLALDAASAGWIAALCLHTDRADGMAALIWLSSDQGVSWRPLVAPAHGDLNNLIRVGGDGVVDLVTLDSGETGVPVGKVRHYRGGVDGRPFERLFEGDEPQPIGLGHDGASWALSWGRARGQLTATGASAPTSPHRVARWDVLLASNRRQTVASAGGAIFRLDGDREIGEVRLPGAIDRLAVDGIGRVLASAGGEAIRYSPAHGWRRLFEIPAR